MKDIIATQIAPCFLNMRQSERKIIFIICSKAAYEKVKEIADKLEAKDYEIIYPNCYEDPSQEATAASQGENEHTKFKQTQYENSMQKAELCDAVLVLNYDKICKVSGRDMTLPNYIGGATLLEIYDAYKLGKKILVLNEINGPFCSDEVKGFNPTVLYGDIEKIDL